MVTIPKTWRDGLFKIRYGFQGIPRTFVGQSLRLDESLRRWNLEGEDVVAETVQAQLKSGDTFLDIGANFGLHTLHAAKRVGSQGSVFAFEPVPKNLRLLQRNVTLTNVQAQTQIVPAAVSNQPEPTLEFYVPGDEVAVTASLQSTQNTQKIQVKNVRLDDFWVSINQPIHLIKIDVEGAELDVLRGAKTVLQTWHPILLIEVHGFALPNFGASIKDLRAFLAELGYHEMQVLNHQNRDDYFHALYLPNSESKSGLIRNMECQASP